MVNVEIITLGAGSEVGRSCFQITIADTTVLVDAGVHLTPKSEADRVPKIPGDRTISAAIITHYHLDHIGALPYLTEISDDLKTCPEILMSVPTKILSPNLLIDYCKGNPIYCPNHVWSCFGSDKITVFGMGEEIRLKANPSFLIQTVYAGHVVGGVMLILKYAGVTVVYTGDFSVVPDALLNPICISPLLIPARGVDIVISEATHATTVTPINRSLSTIHSELASRIFSAIERGGRVLIPLFAVGRTQEIATILRSQLGPNIPLYTTSPAGFRASILASTLHRQWLRDNVECADLNVRLLDKDDFPPNSIVFASPSMLEGGASLRLFGQICDDPKNLVVLTGYCSTGTVGNSVILFASKPYMKETVVFDGPAKLNVYCECMYVPFSNHTDSVGIEHVLRQLRPTTSIVLVHGEREKMVKFKSKLKFTCSIDIPKNYETLSYDITVPKSAAIEHDQVISVSRKLVTSLPVSAIVGIIHERL